MLEPLTVYCICLGHILVGYYCNISHFVVPFISEIAINAAGCSQDFHCATPGAVCSSSTCICNPVAFFFDGIACAASKFSSYIYRMSSHNYHGKQCFRFMDNFQYFS